MPGSSAAHEARKDDGEKAGDRDGSQQKGKGPKADKLSKRRLILHKLVNEFRDQDAVSGPVSSSQLTNLELKGKGTASELSSQVPAPIQATSPTIGGAPSSCPYKHDS